MNNKPTRNNHYIPQMYLKNWADEKSFISVYSILVPDSRVPYWERKPIASQAKWDSFYNREIEGSEIDDIEKWLSEEIETPAKSVFNKIFQGVRLNNQDVRILNRYIVTQYLRTPAFCQQMLNEKWVKAEQINKAFENLLKNKPFPKISDKKTFYSDADKLLPFRLTVDPTTETAQIEWVWGRGIFLQYVKHAAEDIVLGKIHWQIVHAAEGVKFPTSDDPVILLNFWSFNKYNFEGHFNVDKTIIILPLSPNILLFSQRGVNMDLKNIDNSYVWSMFFRKIIIEHAFRYVYADEKQTGMSLLNPRIVNKEAYFAEQKNRENWYSEQSNAEKPFFKTNPTYV